MNPTREEISEAVLKYRQDKQSDAVELLYHTGFKAAYHTAYQFTYEYDQSQDLAQSSVIHGLNHIDQLGKAESYIAWIKKITERKCLDYLKSAYHQKNQTFTDSYDPINELEYDPEDEKITFQPEEQLSEKTRTDIVKEVLSQLPETQKTITMMYFYDNLTMNEIADQLNVATSTVIGRLQMAKKTIRSAITDIQRRGDIKLYNVSPIAVFMWLLGRFEATEEVPYVNVQVPEFNSAEGVVNTAKKAVLERDSIVQQGSKATAGAVKGSSAGLSMAAKIGLSIALLAGGSGAVYALMNNAEESAGTPQAEEKKPEDEKDQIPEEIKEEEKKDKQEKQEEMEKQEEEKPEEQPEPEPVVEEPEPVETPPAEQTVVAEPAPEPAPEPEPEVPAEPALLPYPTNADIENYLRSTGIGDYYPYIIGYSVAEYGTLDACYEARDEKIVQLMDADIIPIYDNLIFDRQTGWMQYGSIWGGNYRDGMTYEDAYNAGILITPGTYVAYDTEP